MVPEVAKCTVVECFYNREDLCYAHSILVGSEEPVCETFTLSSDHTNKHGEADVGACHVANCEHNDKSFCHAVNDIEVGWDDNTAVCVTFESKATMR